MSHEYQPPSRGLKTVTALYAICWIAAWAAELFRFQWPHWATWTPGIVFGFSLPLGLAWAWWAWRTKKSNPIVASLAGTGVYVLFWQLALFTTDALVWDSSRVTIFQYGQAGLFFIGLLWAIWWVDRRARAIERKRIAELGDQVTSLVHATIAEDRADVDDVRFRSTRLIWNPLDPLAWYYGRRGRKLNQSLTVLVAYSCLFVLAVLLLSNTRGCQETYELPAGGGEQKQLAQTVKIQKVIRKKFVINPFSAFKIDVPPIDQVKLQLQEVTKHAYTVGFGEGQGAGFAGGTARGKVRLIRLQYSGGDWDLNFGVGSDQNMLIEYGVRTSQKVAEQTESRTIYDLKNFPKGKAPPFVFMTGQKSISLTNAEIKILQEYLGDKHGMLFGSNGGSGHWHNQFLAMMNQVAPDVRPVPVPLDDPIHSLPYQIPFLPYVAPHGGKEALGWYKDGRWIAYYHPGDISDAWCDDHAGVKAEVWEACYQLGTNVIFYAHTEHAKWLQSQQQGGK